MNNLVIILSVNKNFFIMSTCCIFLLCKGVGFVLGEVGPRSFLSWVAIFRGLLTEGLLSRGVYVLYAILPHCDIGEFHRPDGHCSL